MGYYGAARMLLEQVQRGAMRGNGVMGIGESEPNPPLPDNSL